MLKPPIPTPKEFEQKRTISYAMMMWIFISGISLGALMVMAWFSLAEVDGVRSDMTREDQHLKDQIESNKKRMDRLIINHNRDKEAHK